jgi:LPPG:FO 2-phospho-L-lactate transferase
MKVAALAGGIGAGKFLRGLARLLPGDDLTVIINVADDVEVHGLHVSPDPDSVTYWLGDAFDRERGWGRRGETFRAAEELRAFGAEDAWFSLGDLDLATHLYRTSLMRRGVPLSEITRRLSARFGVEARLLPASDDRIETRIECADHDTGVPLDLPFQEYWVRRGGADPVTGVRYAGADDAKPASGVLPAIEGADAIVFCPSNPVVSIGPILAIPGVRRRSPLATIGRSASAVAEHYVGLLSAWLLDEIDRELLPRVESLGLRAGATDTIMTDDERATEVASTALDLLA